MRPPGDCGRLFGVLALVLARVEAALEESSDAYLRNVVGELQLLNGLASGPADLSLPTPGASSDRRDQEPRPRTRSPRPGAAHPQLDYCDLAAAAAGEGPCRHVRLRSQAPVYLPGEPDAAVEDPLGLTTAELAAMYRKAIERGAPLRYGSLMEALGQPAPPPAPPAPPAPPEPQDPRYAYYFYPLHSFRHELAPSHGYRTVPYIKYDSAPAEDSKKETSTTNPILVGISSFLGMALLFVLSMFFYPRFMHYMHFPFVATSRTSFQNEFAHLASFVTEAIDHYNKRVRKKSRLSPSIK